MSSVGEDTAVVTAVVASPHAETAPVDLDARKASTGAGTDADTHVHPTHHAFTHSFKPKMDPTNVPLMSSRAQFEGLLMPSSASASASMYDGQDAHRASVRPTHPYAAASAEISAGHRGYVAEPPKPLLPRLAAAKVLLPSMYANASDDAPLPLRYDRPFTQSSPAGLAFVSDARFLPRVRPDKKPSLSYASMIVEAFERNGNRLMTLTEIYTCIADKYPYFRGAPSGWKVRLSASMRRASLLTYTYLGCFLV